MSTSVPSDFVYNASYVFQVTSQAAQSAQTLVEKMTELSNVYYTAKLNILQKIREKLTGLAAGENNRVKYKVLFLTDLIEETPDSDGLSLIYKGWKIEDIFSELGISITTSYRPDNLHAKKSNNILDNSFLESNFNEGDFPHLDGNKYMKDVLLNSDNVNNKVCFFMQDIFKNYVDDGQAVQQLVDNAISKIRESTTQQQNAASRIQTFWDQLEGIQEKISSASLSVMKR